MIDITTTDLTKIVQWVEKLNPNLKIKISVYL